MNLAWLWRWCPCEACKAQRRSYVDQPPVRVRVSVLESREHMVPPPREERWRYYQADDGTWRQIAEFAGEQDWAVRSRRRERPDY